eukprot:7205781-Pyramimonas_sp.AAC.1
MPKSAIGAHRAGAPATRYAAPVSHSGGGYPVAARMSKPPDVTRMSPDRPSSPRGAGVTDVM